MSDRERKDFGLTTDEMTRQIYVRIVGDGTEANPGLDKRVDRLESKMGIFQWVSGTAMATAVGMLVTWGISKLKGGA
jgi:hypothetical protein